MGRVSPSAAATFTRPEYTVSQYQRLADAGITVHDDWDIVTIRPPDDDGPISSLGAACVIANGAGFRVHHATGEILPPRRRPRRSDTMSPKIGEQLEHALRRNRRGMWCWLLLMAVMYVSLSVAVAKAPSMNADTLVVVVVLFTVSVVAGALGTIGGRIWGDKQAIAKADRDQAGLSAAMAAAYGQWIENPPSQEPREEPRNGSD